MGDVLTAKYIQHFVKEKEKIKESVLNHFAVLFLEMAHVLEIYQKTGLVYIDFKMEQLLVTMEGLLILGDLDSGREVNKECRDLVYTKSLAPEEVSKRKLPLKKSDIHTLAQQIIRSLNGLQPDFLEEQHVDTICQEIENRFCQKVIFENQIDKDGNKKLGVIDNRGNFNKIKEDIEKILNVNLSNLEEAKTEVYEDRRKIIAQMY